jgi:hypothetical protein
VTGGPIVVLTWEHERFARFWLVTEYLPEAADHDRRLPSAAQIAPLLGACDTVPVPVAADCADGFFAAYWRRPQAYLDPEVRGAISGLSLLEEGAVARMVSELGADLASGAWHRRHADLTAQPDHDVGYRLLVARP